MRAEVPGRHPFIEAAVLRSLVADHFVTAGFDFELDIAEMFHLQLDHFRLLSTITRLDCNSSSDRPVLLSYGNKPHTSPQRPVPDNRTQSGAANCGKANTCYTETSSPDAARPRCVWSSLYVS